MLTCLTEGVCKGSRRDSGDGSKGGESSKSFKIHSALKSGGGGGSRERWAEATMKQRTPFIRMVRLVSNQVLRFPKRLKRA